ncbi:acetyl-CoA carboxylase biotin carboxyl carrier protein [Embleya sp. NBC_00896]|uniref:acetyl-CoA carboxylase biotin carboxyl carrier protein n=1 Tax=Embleya sp. NBC_00896 TaxID=2975961 RepID=UPI002F915681|nr:acetyl-CoA carboxylase biotin carboxyl carrier protein [Embleya sp. NBC_00896]
MNDADHTTQAATLAALRDALGRILSDTPEPPTRVVVRSGGSSIEVAWPAAAGARPATRSAPSAPASPAPLPSPATPPPAAGHTVRAPLVGTFYRSPEPGAPPFAEVGDVVRVGQQLAVIEAMKLMNAIEADRDGRVTAVLIDNAQGVEFDQPLFELDPEYDGGTHPDPSPESAATAPVTPVTPVAPEPNVGR